MSDMIYLKQRPVNELLAMDDWSTAMQRYDTFSQGMEATLVGLDMIRQTKAKMMLTLPLEDGTKPKNWPSISWLYRAVRLANLSHDFVCCQSCATITRSHAQT